MEEVNESSENKSEASPLIPKKEELSPMDVLLNRVNGEGRYQWGMFMIFNLHWFLVGWCLLGMEFYFEEVAFDCTEPVLASTSARSSCAGWIRSSGGCSSPACLARSPTNGTPFMLCDYSYIKSLLQALIPVGSLFGFFLFPYFADNKGRKSSLCVSWGCFTVGLLILALANGPIMVGIGQFLVGFGGNPAITLDFSFINEQSLGKSRQYFSIGVQIFFAIAESLLGYVLYWLADWRISIYILLGVAVGVNFLHYFLLETPKFMISRDVPKTLEIFNRIARVNGRQELTMEDIL
jgi:MFS family permease